MQLCEPARVAAVVTRLLEKLDIPYAVVGSLASSLHGVPRATQDVDIVAAIPKTHVEAFAAELKDEFYVDENMILDAIANMSSFNIIHLNTILKVDIFVTSQKGRSKEELDRAKNQIIDESEGIQFSVLSAEDTIVNKLKWYRMGNEISSNQWNDVLGILRVQAGNLKLERLKRAAKQLDVTDLLQRVCAEAEITLP